LLNFIAIDLQVYKIFKITQVSFLGDTMYVYLVLNIVTNKYISFKFTLAN